MRRVATPLLMAMALTLSSCGSSTPPPEETVEGFLAQEWEEGETADDYLSEIAPYLTDEALAEAREVFGDDLDGQATFSYENVKIEDVLTEDETAEVTVSYKVTYSYLDEQEAYEQTDTMKLALVGDKWLLSE